MNLIKKIVNNFINYFFNHCKEPRSIPGNINRWDRENNNIETVITRDQEETRYPPPTLNNDSTITWAEDPAIITPLMWDPGAIPYNDGITYNSNDRIYTIQHNGEKVLSYNTENILSILLLPGINISIPKNINGTIEINLSHGMSIEVIDNVLIIKKAFDEEENAN